MNTSMLPGGYTEFKEKKKKKAEIKAYDFPAPLTPIITTAIPVKTKTEKAT